MTLKSLDQLAVGQFGKGMALDLEASEIMDQVWFCLGKLPNWRIRNLVLMYCAMMKNRLITHPLVKAALWLVQED